MSIFKKTSGVLLVACAFIGLAGSGFRIRAEPRFNPCDGGSVSTDQARDADDEGFMGSGLFPSDDGQFVYDANQGLCWLADGNLAGDSSVRARLGVAGINPNGTMDYATALDWVGALNADNGGQGFLGHKDWQLPVTPEFDPACTSFNAGSFGVACTRSALGSLYNVGLARTYPDSVVVPFINRDGPLRNLQAGNYWADGSDGGGEKTFAFTIGLRFSNTTKYNYFHMLPMVDGAIGTPPGGSGVIPYTSGPAAGKAVYDSISGLSWTLDANLAAVRDFGVRGTTTILPDVGSSVVTAPLIDRDGSMLFGTASDPGGWLAAMNRQGFAGTSNWILPTPEQLKSLFDDLQLQFGDLQLESHRRLGPFRNLQPFFYWSCQRKDDNAGGGSQSPCDPKLNPPDNQETPPVPMRWSFDFDDGFQGTDEITKQFYVAIYFPAPAGHGARPRPQSR